MDTIETFISPFYIISNNLIIYIIINNIEYYTIKQLKIEKCPYGDNYKEECFILKDNLHCVHKFYSEKV